MAEETLLPGYKQVQEFGQDDEYESEEEVSYVTLDLGNIEPTLVPSSSTYRLIGLDTPTPFLQLSGTIFRGNRDSLLGSELIFTDDKANKDRTKKGVTHVANTEQRIIFKEVRLRPKDTTGTQEQFRPPYPYEQGIDRDMDAELFSGGSQADFTSSFEAYGDIVGSGAISSGSRIQLPGTAGSDNVDEAEAETEGSNRRIAMDPAFGIDSLSGISPVPGRARRTRATVASGMENSRTAEDKEKGKDKVKRHKGKGKEKDAEKRQGKGKQREEKETLTDDGNGNKAMPSYRMG